MKIAFFSDPHLGLKRGSHTTLRSQALLRERLFDQAIKVLEEAEAADMPVFCLGDLFDQFSNDEDVVEEGARIVRRCVAVLSGNHDESNRKDEIGSLRMLGKLHPDFRNKLIFSDDPATPYCTSGTLFQNDWQFVAVPHCFTQETFAASIAEAVQARVEDGFKHSILMLHCNVGSGFGHVEDGGSSLWLTPELQEMVSVFDHVLVGHEHELKQEKNVTVLGNTFPVTFGEIADRYYWVLDLDTGELSKVPLFEAEKEYAEIDVTTILETQGNFEVTQTLIEITGELKASEQAAFAKSMANFWKSNPNLYAVKKAVTVESLGKEKAKVSNTELKTLPEIVSDAVKDAGFLEELQELTAP